MISVSRLFVDYFRKSNALKAINGNDNGDMAVRALRLAASDPLMSHMIPQIAGAALSADASLPCFSTVNVNFGTAFYLWWNTAAHLRTIFRIRPRTAEALRSVNLSFVPETPPESWKNGVIVIESSDPSQPLFRDFFSLCAYFAQDKEKVYRYFFAGLRYPDGARVFGLKANTGKMNEKMAKNHMLLDLPSVNEFLDEGVTETVAQQHEALDMIRFVFATSYFILNPERVDVTKTSGAISQSVVRRGKKQKHSLWSYSDLALREKPSEGVAHGPLNKETLSLLPTIVSPYIRRHEEKIIIVDAHDSHRWRRQDTLGSKKRI